ncbi:MAG: 50S ribosomal protein L24 [Parcubacteria group bacterium]|nr:50S ribosomal protein L24 [Parcubacteria group bacterium]
MKIKKGDNVLIIAGKDKGKKAPVIKVFPKNKSILVEGVNLVKKHRKPKKSGEKGEIIILPRPFSVSRVMLVCPRCSKPARVGIKIEGNKKNRFCKKCQTSI